MWKQTPALISILIPTVDLRVGLGAIEKENTIIAGMRKKSKYLDDKGDLCVPVSRPKIDDCRLSNIGSQKSTILFNKLNFENPTSKGVVKRRGKLTAKHLPKDPRQALEVLSKKKTEIEKLRDSQPEKATELVNRDAWMRAISKAQGLAVRDDTRLLQKVIKRKEKAKEGRKARWEANKKQVERDIRERQLKRNQNISSRREKVKKIRIEKSIKRRNRS